MCNSWENGSIINHALEIRWNKLEDQEKKYREGYTQQSLVGYIQLCVVAHGSFKELTTDYEDFLRQKGLMTWGRDEGRIRHFREFRTIWKNPNVPNTPNLLIDPEEAANMLLTFCQMETFLLSKLIVSLRKKFIAEGGFRENLYKQKMAARIKR